MTPEQRIVVEIGPGDNPMSKKTRPEITSDRYLTLDSDRWALSEVGSDHERIRAHMGGLPFTDSTIDEIWAMNVFGEIIIKGSSVRDYSSEHYINELSRVLKPCGKLFIGEFYWRPAHIRYLAFEDFGFELVPYIGNDIYEFIDKMNLNLKIDADGFKKLSATDPYFLELTKAHQS